MNAPARAPASLSTALATTALALFGIGAGLVSAPAAESMLGAVPSRTRLSFPVRDPRSTQAAPGRWPSCRSPAADHSPAPQGRDRTPGASACAGAWYA